MPASAQARITASSRRRAYPITFGGSQVDDRIPDRLPGPVEGRTPPRPAWAESAPRPASRPPPAQVGRIPRLPGGLTRAAARRRQGLRDLPRGGAAWPARACIRRHPRRRRPAGRRAGPGPRPGEPDAPARSGHRAQAPLPGGRARAEVPRLQVLLDPGQELRRGRPVDDAVVPATSTDTPCAGWRLRRRRTTGRFSTASKARIAHCGGLMTGTLMIEPNGPGLVIVNVPPWTSSGVSFLFRARVATSLTARARPIRFIVSAPLTTGTMRPLVQGDRDPQVHVVLADQLVAADLPVDVGEGEQRLGDRPGHERHVRQARGPRAA